MSNPEYKFIGIKTNKGFDSIHRNFMKGIEKVGLDSRFNLRRINVKPAYHGTRSFTKIVLRKLRIIKEYIDKGFDVLYSDLDIIFLKDPTDYIKGEIRDNDILILDDSYMYRDSRGFRITSQRLNPGFFFVKSNERTSKLFSNPNIDDYKLLLKQGVYKRKFYFDDQDLIHNRIICDNKENIKYKTLPLNLFPNGKIIYNYSLPLDKAYILHFNYVSIISKIAKMKEHKVWYIT
ncbi:MAG: hypothetical protein GTO02_16300 [Candidatus Dadabacteria bacterium]|nr:hypothetical protein [Candidatus Dadabacteria bacterium]NIQ15893.1 hypothetical protein [Candidatus Dadabacteria bacterium]